MVLIAVTLNVGAGAALTAVPILASKVVFSNFDTNVNQCLTDSVENPFPKISKFCFVTFLICKSFSDKGNNLRWRWRDHDKTTIYNSVKGSADVGNNFKED